MHKRRPSQSHHNPSNHTNTISSQTAHATEDQQPSSINNSHQGRPVISTAASAPIPSSSSSSFFHRRRSSSSTGSPTQPRLPSSQFGRVRALSSAIGIQFDIESEDEDQATFHTGDKPEVHSTQSKKNSMPSSHVLPFSLSRPGRARISLSMLFLLTFLLAVFTFSLFPASRNRGKAAVDSIGGYAGHVWNEWKPGSTSGGSGNRQPSVHRLRERPSLHPDPTKTTRCTRSFDGLRNVVQYAIMIDAGSTGSRVHIYKFNYCDSMPELEDEVFEMLRPGLSSFRGDPKAAADSLRPLLKTSLAAVPKSLQACTPIAVKATAGLRLLGSTDSKAILHAVRKMLTEEYPFQLADGKRGVTDVTHGFGSDEGRAVEIMEGKDEGVFAWITVNYLLGLIGPPLPGEGGTGRKRTAAVMDLGGASTQIVFEPNVETGSQGMHPGEHVYELKNFGGRDYTLYQNSYLGYGLMQARKSINSLTAYAYSYSHPDVVRTGQASASPNEVEIPSPCFALGTDKMTTIAKIGAKNEEVQAKFVGTTGGFKACRRLVEVMMDKDAVCATAPCSFAGVYQPSLMSTFRSGAPIVALSYFYDRLAPLGFSSSSSSSSSSYSKDQTIGFTISELASLAKDVCRPPSTWTNRFPPHTYPEALKELYDRPESCLDLTYLHSLLSLGYELQEDDDDEWEEKEGQRKGGGGRGRGGRGKDLRVRIEKKLAGTELGWALGAAVGMVDEVEGCWRS